jgi:hypothetical protein
MHGTLPDLPPSIRVVGLNAAMRSTIPRDGPDSAKTYGHDAESAAEEGNECEEGCGKICRSPQTASFVWLADRAQATSRVNSNIGVDR